MSDATAGAVPPGGGWHQVIGYDWKSITVPNLRDWTPTRTVSVVIPAYQCQAKLDRTLAALAHQRYPADLLEVVIADDGSPEPLRLPRVRPENTRLLSLTRDKEWGRARACHAGAEAAHGEVLLFLDADMVAFPDHVAAHARWHHVSADAVTLGHKLFVDFEGVTVEAVAEAAHQDRLQELLDDRPHTEHDWVESFIARTEDLTQYSPKLFMAAVGSTVGLRTELYREAGGFRTDMRSGEDMEIGYRLMTAGAFFVPEREARSWHQGPATYMSRAAEVRRRNRPNFSNYIPAPRPFRPAVPGRQYAVPKVTVLVAWDGVDYERAAASVDSLLGAAETDLRVEICCAVTADEVDLLHAHYRDEGRVSLRPDPPASGFPSPYTLQVSGPAGFQAHAVSALMRLVERDQLGVVDVLVPDSDAEVILWRTAALHRARRAAIGDEDINDVVARLFGEGQVDGRGLGIVDLRVARPAAGTVGSGGSRNRRMSKRYRRLRRKHDQLLQRRLVRLALRLGNLRRRRGRG